MSIVLNQTIVWCRDPGVSAGFLVDILGLPPPERFLHFLVVDLANGVSLDRAGSTITSAAAASTSAIGGAPYAGAKNLPPREYGDKDTHINGGESPWIVELPRVRRLFC